MKILRYAVKWLLARMKVNISLDIWIQINGKWQRITHTRLAQLQKKGKEGLVDEVDTIAFVEQGKDVTDKNSIIKSFIV